MSDIKLLAVGDISLRTKTGEYPFRYIHDVLQDKDILFGNLETVLAYEIGYKKEKAVLLYTDPSNSTYLNKCSFDILNLANNHTMDLGITGLQNTLSILAQEGIEHIGVNNDGDTTFKIINREGINFCFLAYSYDYFCDSGSSLCSHSLELSKILSDVKVSKSLCDFVIVSLHWGYEHTFYPSPEQVQMAHHIVDAGADIILGHHPHTIQGIENYRNSIIAYSLGNFQFECGLGLSKNNVDPKASYSFIISITFKNSSKYLEVIPIVIDENNLPHRLGQGEIENFHKFIAEISRPLQNQSLTNFFWYQEIAEVYLNNSMAAWKKRIKKYGVNHLISCAKWLLSPFVVKCYGGYIIRKIKSYFIINKLYDFRKR